MTLMNYDKNLHFLFSYGLHLVKTTHNVIMDQILGINIWRQFCKQVIFRMFSKKGHIFMKNESLNIKLSGIIPNTYENISRKFQVIMTM